MKPQKFLTAVVLMLAIGFSLSSTGSTCAATICKPTFSLQTEGAQDAEKVEPSNEEIANWIKQLDSPVFNDRLTASNRLKAAKAGALDQVFQHAVSRESKIESASICLRLIREWELQHDLAMHDRLLHLLNSASKHDSRPAVIEKIRIYLNEGYECTESEALELLRKMGAPFYFIKKENYYQLHIRSDCSREKRKSLWPLRYVNSNCLVLFENVNQIDDHVARNLAACPGLVQLFCPTMTETQMNLLGDSKSLKKLYLKNIVKSEATLKSLSKIPTLELLSFNSKQDINTSLRDIVLFPELRQIFFNRRNISDPIVLDYLTGCKKLEHLNLNAFDMPSHKFRNMERFKNVTHLELPTGTDDKLIELVSKMPSLKSIEMEYAFITDKAAPFLAMHKDLESLEIEQTFITDESCKHLAKLTKLKTVRIDGTFVTPAGVSLIEDANRGLDVKGWITEKHDDAYVEALQQLQFTGCNVRPNFGVSFSGRDAQGRLKLPCLRLPGCSLNFTLTDSERTNATFLKYATKVSDLDNLAIWKCDESTAIGLLALPETAEITIGKTTISKETIDKLKKRFKRLTIRQ